MYDLASRASAAEHADPRRRRLLFRAWRRGTQESDLILGSFAEDAVERWSDAQLEAFEALLECSDADLFDWIYGFDAPPPEHDHEVMRRLRAFCLDRFDRPSVGSER